MNKKKRLAIILVNWNGTDDTINCINSIQGSSYKDYFIIVVDNGSHETELLKLTKCDFDIILIKAGENLGYTGGNNVGIKRALDNDAEYILLLNNDTYIAPDALSKLVESADVDKQVGILSPKIFFHPDRHLIWSAGARFNTSILIGYLTGYKKEDDEIYNIQSDVDYVSGCAMLIRSQVIKEVGFLNDDYFAVCEDIDYCFRVKNAGYRIKYEPSSVIWHIESSSSGGSDAPQYAYYQTRNYFFFHNLWAKNISQLIISQLYYTAFVGKRAFLFSLSGNWRGVLAISLGVLDVIRRNLGRRYYPILVKRVSKK